jgi:7-carboxy-7-deazaguanine synthase
VSLIVNEIFFSIQGESSFAGQPCVFIRLTGCNLRCSYCDTQYAYNEGREYTVDQILEIVQSYQCSLVEITGGEPLLQEETPHLVNHLLSKNFRVLMETNGSIDINRVSTKCIRIVDIKCPSSGEQSKNDLENLNRLSTQDELKFVIGDRADYEFACGILESQKMARPSSGKIHFSPVYGKMQPEILAK